DDPSIVAPVNETANFIFCDWNNVEQFEKLFFENIQDLAGVIIEGIQGIGGIQIPSRELMTKISELCAAHSVFFISDEIQSGYARSGKFFAHQHFGVKPNIITTAKGMANGFPIGGVLVSPKIAAKHKMLGTTFGGNHLACAAAIAVLEIIEKEKLIEESFQKGEYLIQKIKEIPQIKEIRGKGLLIGIDFEIPASQVSKKLREEFKIFVGSATNPLTMRLLPPLTISYPEMDYFISSLKSVLNSI
ncbi:MAG: aspartate aminotransferase family protein, partial [Kaistella sp.]